MVSTDTGFGIFAEYEKVYFDFRRVMAYQVSCPVIHRLRVYSAIKVLWRSASTKFILFCSLFWVLSFCVVANRVFPQEHYVELKVFCSSDCGARSSAVCRIALPLAHICTLHNF